MSDGNENTPPLRKRWITRRRLVLGAVGGAGALAAARLSLPRVLRPGPVRTLQGEALALKDTLLEGIDRTLVWDVHVHLVGLGHGPDGGTGCWVHPHMRSLWHPIRNFQFDAYAAAAGISPDDPAADRLYLERLLALHRAGMPEGKIVLLAFDWNRDEAGVKREAASTFHTPNDYVFAVARDNPDVRVCASVHPYRSDALDELQRVTDLGAVAVKWLPNAMGIDPASPRCDAFYERTRELGMPLLIHTGHEQAVESVDAQELGNPVRLRRALDSGVRVIAAHCAGTGAFVDPDAPAKGEQSSHRLFLQLMDEPRYESLLFGDISAMTQVNRCGSPLRTMIERSDLHPRLLFGSDYPLPAIRSVVSTRVLQSKGYITAEQRPLLNEVFDANPLLFDLLVKRALSIEVDGEKRGFGPTVFESGRFFT